MQTLKHFGKLRPAERKLVNACRTGAEAIVAATRPEERTDDNAVRGPLIRHLSLGGDPDAPTHAKGVQLRGAWIDDALDFGAANIPGPLWLTDCHIAEVPVFLDAAARTIGLSGSKVPGLEADRLTTTGGVFLHDKFEATGEVRLLGARIGGDLSCVAGKFHNPDGKALSADQLTTTGGVFLRDKFEAKGEVRLLGARIGGDLDCVGGKFHNPDGRALNADRLTTTGGVFLCDKFEAKGEVRLPGARIGGTLSCVGGKFHNPDGDALNADSINVAGAFFLRDDAEVHGELDLTRARFGLIADETACWPDKGELRLDQATYDGFGGPAARIGVRERIDWLGLQHPKTGPVDFRPQPYEHLAKVLRAAGHHADARRVLIKKERLMRKHGLIEGFWSRLWHRLSGAFVGYGYHPSLALLWLLGFIAIGALWFDQVYKDGAMVPNDSRVLLSEDWIRCDTLRAFAGARGRPETAAECWLRSDKGRDYQRFLPAVYAADAFLPIVDLHQESKWIPQPERATNGWMRGARIFLWAYIAIGWALTALAVAGFTGLVKRD